MDTALRIARLLAWFALTVLLSVLAWQAWNVPQQAIRELQALREEASALGLEALEEVTRTREMADARLQEIQVEARAELRELRFAADRQLSQTNESIAGVATEARQTIAAVRPVLESVPPALASANTALLSTTAMVDNLNAIADDLLPDVRAVIQTGTDAARSTAETMSAIEAVAPTLTRNVDQAVCQLPAIAENTAGITHNIKRAIGLPATIFRGIREGFKRIVPFI